jgi:hypothetical protein
MHRFPDTGNYLAKVYLGSNPSIAHIRRYGGIGIHT